MKKLIILLFGVLNFQMSFGQNSVAQNPNPNAQAVDNPYYNQNTLDYTTLERVEFTATATTLFFKFKDLSNTRFKRYMIKKPQLFTNTGLERPLIKIEGLEEESYHVYSNGYGKQMKELTWTASFAPISDDVTTLTVNVTQGFGDSYFSLASKTISDIQIRKRVSSAPTISNSSPSSNFFTCIHWLDKNMDAKPNIDELEGIKASFKANEDKKVSFYSNWQNKAGSSVTFKVFTPSGSVYDTKKYNLNSDNAFEIPSYIISEMLSNNNAGKWTYEWYLNDNTVYSGTVSLTSY